MSKVLVTGGTGFVGSHLVEKLLEQGRTVRVLALKEPMDEIEKENEEIVRDAGAEVVYGDLRNPSSLQKATKGCDTVFHLAAISRPMSIPDKYYYDVNVVGTKNILEAAQAAGVKKFVHTSTVSVLGVSPDGHPLKEDEFQYEDQLYGLSKREGEFTALLFHHEHKLPVTVIRPCLVYGPRCIVRRIMFKYVKLGVFPVFTGGNAKMEFVYVDNVVDALLLAEKNEKAVGEVFNITDGQSYKIGEILNTIADVQDVKRPWIKLHPKTGFYLGAMAETISRLFGIHPPFSRTASHWMSEDVNVYDCSYAKKVLGYLPKVNLKDGVERTVSWFEGRGEL